jgi:hypothetical protein
MMFPLSAVCKDNDETKECTSRAILLAGDINAHTKLWDRSTKEDK